MTGSVNGETHFWFDRYSLLADNVLLCDKVLFLYKRGTSVFIWQTEKTGSFCKAAGKQVKSSSSERGELPVCNMTGVVPSKDKVVMAKLEL